MLCGEGLTSFFSTALTGYGMRLTTSAHDAVDGSSTGT